MGSFTILCDKAGTVLEHQQLKKTFLQKCYLFYNNNFKTLQLLAVKLGPVKLPFMIITTHPSTNPSIQFPHYFFVCCNPSLAQLLQPATNCPPTYLSVS